MYSMLSIRYDMIGKTVRYGIRNYGYLISMHPASRSLSYGIIGMITS